MIRDLARALVMLLALGIVAAEVVESQAFQTEPIYNIRGFAP